MPQTTPSLRMQSLYHRRQVGRGITTPDVLWVPGAALYWQVSGGTVNFTTVPGWSMPGTLVSVAHGIVPVPALWAGHITEVFAAWRPENTAAGDVLLRFSTVRIKDETSIASALDAIEVTDATPLSTSEAAVTVGTFSALPDDIADCEFLRLSVQRTGTAAADSYDAIIYLMGIGIRIAGDGD